MRCPVDKEEMIVLEYDAVEIDYCVTCEGVWLDEGELELLLGAEGTARLTLTGGTPAPAAGEGKRPCPACRKAMLKECTAGPGGVTYDRCPRGHGLWLDRGELAQLLETGGVPGAGEKVAAFLGGMLEGEGNGEEGTES